MGLGQIFLTQVGSATSGSGKFFLKKSQFFHFFVLLDQKKSLRVRLKYTWVSPLITAGQKYAQGPSPIAPATLLQ